MIYGFKRVLKYVLGTDIAGRNLAVYPDDTFIVSYPRSGNTWTRFLVANLVYPGKPVTFANIESLIPDCEALSSRYVKRVPRPRFIKSHEYFDPRYKKVIYVVRDPRDVALSYYDFSRKYRHIEDQHPLTSYVSDFVAGRLSSADWGTWGENVASWVHTRNGRPGFLLLRYEDMLSNTERELTKVACFLGVDSAPERLASAVERSSADRMRNLEATQGEKWVTTKEKRSDIPFVRTATSGLWKTKLAASSIAEIESAWGPLMKSLGYELTAGQAVPGSEGNCDRTGSAELVKEHT
jgi:sulfotransferase family protein